MDIGGAVTALKIGKRVARAGWNGKGMYLYYVPGDRCRFDFDHSDFIAYPFVVMKTADDKVVPWLCSQTDLLAEDWGVV